MDRLAIVELNRVIKSEIRDIKLHLREKKSLKKELRDKIVFHAVTVGQI